MSRIAEASFLVAPAAVLSCYSGAVGEQLLRTASPMSREVLTKLYSGKTALGVESDIYFLPDNTFKGLIGKPKTVSPITGTWSVAGNELCIYSFRRDDLGTYCDCYEYWSN
jgi:hypothetical protein